MHFICIWYDTYFMVLYKLHVIDKCAPGILICPSIYALL